jgi:hypothetical protein
MADDEVRVHHLDVTRNCDIASLNFAWTGSRQLHPFRAFALHFQRDLFDVENDVGDIFTNASQRRKFVQHVFDLDRRDRNELPSVRPKPRSNGSATKVALRRASLPDFNSSALGFFSSCQFFTLTVMDIP